MPGSVPRPRRLDLNLDLDTPLARLVLAFLFAVVLSLLGCGGTDPADLQPRLGASDPDRGTAGTMVVLTGASFQPGCRVAFDSLPAAAVTFVSPKAVLASAPDGVTLGGVYTITVTNPGGKTDDLPDAFRGVLPELEAVNGVTRPRGLVNSVILFEGKSFGDLVGKGHVWFTDGEGHAVEGQVILDDNWNDEYIVTMVPSSAVSGLVWVETPTGSSNAIRFAVDATTSGGPADIALTDTGTLPEAYLGSLPAKRACQGMVSATPTNALLNTTTALGHLYVLGGVDAMGRPQRTVLHAPVRLDHGVGSWVAELELPQALHSMGVVVHRSWIYVLGGVGEGNQPRAEVYRARIHTDGSLGLWESQPALPEPCILPALTISAETLYAAVGDGSPDALPSWGTASTQYSNRFAHAITLRSGELSGPWGYE